MAKVEDRLGRVEVSLGVLRWISGAAAAGVVGLYGVQLLLFARLADLGSKISAIAVKVGVP